MTQKILFEIKKFEKKNKIKNRTKELPSSFLFTDRRKIPDLKKIINFLPKNCAILIREYDLARDKREIFAKEIIAIARPRKLKILVGKDIALANKIKADGVHFSDLDNLPLHFLQRQKFNKKFIFTLACHSFKSTLKASKLKVDAIFISPIFPTTSHLNTKTIGLQNLAKIHSKSKSRSYLAPRFYALGGITSKNLSSVRKLGLSGFAAINLFSNYL